MRLVLVRHGEAEAALRDVIAGEARCIGLTERGVRQAVALAHRFRGWGELVGCRILLSSPLPRSWQTATLLGEALFGATIEPDPGLCELLPGAADGLTWKAYEERIGSFSMVSSPDRPFAPGGETWSGFTGEASVGGRSAGLCRGASRDR